MTPETVPVSAALPASEPPEPVVEFNDVHVLFRSRLGLPVWALRGFTLSVPRGAVMGLLGPNGAGKTTCISCLLSLIDPQVGTTYDWGRPASRSSMKSDERCGALLEDTRLPPFLSVRAALRMVSSLRGVPSAPRELSRVVELCGVGDLLGRTVATLSKGQARKVGLAAALIGDPQLLVLDEPSAGLDAEARVEFDALVRRLNDGRRTIIIASHLLGDVEATCTSCRCRPSRAGRAGGQVERAVVGGASRADERGSSRGRSELPVLGQLGIGFEAFAIPGPRAAHRGGSMSSTCSLPDWQAPEWPAAGRTTGQRSVCVSGCDQKAGRSVTGFVSLVALYLRDLPRVAACSGASFCPLAAVIAVNYWTTELMSEAVSEGETWDIATRQAASRLDGLMTFLRPWFGFVIVLLAAQLAPESRRNGTTQFVLALGIRRNVLAAAQFVALSIDRHTRSGDRACRVFCRWARHRRAEHRINRSVVVDVAVAFIDCSRVGVRILADDEPVGVLPRFSRHPLPDPRHPQRDQRAATCAATSGSCEPSRIYGWMFPEFDEPS